MMPDELAMTSQKPFCPTCLSDRYLVHLNGCSTWVIAVEVPAPQDQPGKALAEAELVAQGQAEDW